MRIEGFRCSRHLRPCLPKGRGFVLQSSGVSALRGDEGPGGDGSSAKGPEDPETEQRRAQRSPHCPRWPWHQDEADGGSAGWVTGHAASPQPACATRLRSGRPQQICPGSTGGGRKDRLPPVLSGEKAQQIPASCPGSSVPLLHIGKAKGGGNLALRWGTGGARQTNGSQEGDVRTEKALVSPCPALKLRPAP